MNGLQMQHLSAKNSDFSISHMDFSKKISSEHLFRSIEECIDFLKHVVFNISFNSDDISFSDVEKTPILYANIIDESICSIIYEAFLLINRRDKDALAHNRINIESFMVELYHKIDKLQPSDTKFTIFSALLIILGEIAVILNPIDKHSEEINYGKLSLYYYNVMYTTYRHLLSNGIEREYLEKNMNIYRSYLNDSYAKYSPMGYCE